MSDIPNQSTPSSLRCRHIGAEDRRCGSPAMRGERFCYHHHQTRRPVENLRQRRARQSTFSLPQPNSRGDIQQALGTLMVRIAANDIDLRRAGLLLYALQIANSNLNHHQNTGTRSNSPRQSIAEPTACADSEKEQEITQSPSTSDISHQKCRPDQSPSTSNISHQKCRSVQSLSISDASHQKCHPSQSLSISESPHQKCHPERSVAESKDLRLKPQPEHTSLQDIHYGCGPTPDHNHPQTSIPNPNRDFTPPPPLWRHISNATGAALLDSLARSEGAEPLPQSPEDRQPEQAVTSTGAKQSEETSFSTDPAIRVTAQTPHDGATKLRADCLDERCALPDCDGIVDGELNITAGSVSADLHPGLAAEEDSDIPQVPACLNDGLA